MLSGFNTNITHRGILFHVQTEDSGRDRPHVISHLYHGGTILASEKRVYAELLELPDLEDQVRRLMEEQHRAMVERLRAGDFDELIGARLGAEAFGDSAATTRPRQAPEEEPTRPGSAHAKAPRSGFGEGIVSEKPLDEVILAYLVENARKRKRSPE